MNTSGRIITIGLTAAWDMHCKVEGLDWSNHKTVQSYTKVPAGKALNINKALAYLGRSSIAAGIWSENDHALMKNCLKPLAKYIDIKITPAPGNTRTNITIEDTAHNRHMHLRFPDELCSNANLDNLAGFLKKLVKPNDICVLAGSLPRDEFIDATLNVIRVCSNNNAKIFLDTNGRHFPAIVNTGQISLISPNIEELGELLGTKVNNTPEEITQAAGPLLDKVAIILVSRGKEGALTITRDTAVSCTLTAPPRPVASEVACGDNLLAGFIAGRCEKPDSLSHALEKGVKLATAQAWGLTKTTSFAEIEKNVTVNTACSCQPNVIPLLSG